MRTRAASLTMACGCPASAPSDLAPCAAAERASRDATRPGFSPSPVRSAKGSRGRRAKIRRRSTHDAAPHPVGRTPPMNPPARQAELGEEARCALPRCCHACAPMPSDAEAARAIPQKTAPRSCQGIKAPEGSELKVGAGDRCTQRVHLFPSRAAGPLLTIRRRRTRTRVARTRARGARAPHACRAPHARACARARTHDPIARRPAR